MLVVIRLLLLVMLLWGLLAMIAHRWRALSWITHRHSTIWWLLVRGWQTHGWWRWWRWRVTPRIIGCRSWGRSSKARRYRRDRSIWVVHDFLQSLCLRRQHGPVRILSNTAPQFSPWLGLVGPTKQLGPANLMGVSGSVPVVSRLRSVGKVVPQVRTSKARPTYGK